VTWLEAAAVVAFRRVESDLVALGAPSALIEAARRAQADEIRHAREASALARRFGAAERPLEVAPPAARDAFAIALENAVEGCVRETYGALVAAYQARRAEDPSIRRFFERIAADEANHAALSHDIAAWLEPQLTAEERARIAAAKTEALAELYAPTEASPFARIAGLPTPAHARQLLDGMQRDILAA
jgi:rubrerythrin